MCFSASASFASAAALAGSGAASIALARDARRLPLALIPLLFAVQQACEGVEWVGLGHGADVTAAAAVFLVVAEVVWPLWIPLTMLALEVRPGRRRLLVALSCLGVAVGLWFAWNQAMHGLRVRIAGHHLRYERGARDGLAPISDGAYALATILPPLVCSAPLVWIFGVAVGIAYAATLIAFTDSAISVWCFFAAAISLTVIVVVRAPARGRHRLATNDAS